VACDCNTLGVDSRCRFQERQSSHHIVEVTRGAQHELQMLASFLPIRCFLALQHVLHEWALVG
jgi:hypothetical protein